MWSALLDGSHVNIGIAYLAGFGMFFASCLIPLVPTYLAILAGTPTAQTSPAMARRQRLWGAWWFVMGFTGSFVALSFLLQRLALVLGPIRPFLQHLSGAVFILTGLVLFGWLPFRWLKQEWRWHSFTQLPPFLQPYASHLQWLVAFLLGVFFGFGWTPCIGPVLAVILFWSAQQATLWLGLGLLVAFGLGMGTPFMLVAVAFDFFFPLFQKWQPAMHALQLLAAVILIATGFMLLTGQANLWHQLLGQYRFTF